MATESTVAQKAARRKLNTKRAHQGRNMNGMTPIQAFKKGMKSRKSPEKKAG